MIAAEHAERWRVRSEELTAEATVLSEVAQTRNDWEAIKELEDASRRLWSAYAWVARQHEEASDA